MLHENVNRSFFDRLRPDEFGCDRVHAVDGRIFLAALPQQNEQVRVIHFIVNG